MQSYNQILTIFRLKGAFESGLSRNELSESFYLTSLMFNINVNIEQIIDDMLEHDYLELNNNIIYVTQNKKLKLYLKHIDVILKAHNSHKYILYNIKEKYDDLSIIKKEDYESESEEESNIKDDEDTILEDEDTFHVIKSFTCPNTYYIIDIYNNECSCPSFTHSKSDPKVCKHLGTTPESIITSNLTTNVHLCNCNSFTENKKCIHMKEFISLYELDDPIEKKSVNIIKVKSMTYNNISYDIDLDNKTCSCPSFEYCKVLPKKCKHLNEVLV
jgi:hypothetical protein